LTDSHARAFWTLAPGQGGLRDEPLGPLEAGHVRVRTLYSGISRGSEALVFQGRVPASQYAAMRAPFQAGEFPGPVKYGYACVGTIEDGPASRHGERVFCLHPHQDRFDVPAEAAVPLPPGVPPGRAVLAANLETAVNATWDASPATGDRVVVLGGGVVGCLLAWLAARVPGTEVVLADPDPERAAVAEALGAAWAAPETLTDDDRDLVFDASGRPDGLRRALTLAGDEATVAVLSWFGDREVSLPLGEAFHSRRLTLRSSQVGRVAPARAARWSTRRRLRLALALLADPAVDVLISGESDFEALPDTVARLARESSGVLCHRVRYPAAAD
jgi:threonine dehydrogenase-like Zn-dependent dehydrogenase